MKIAALIVAAGRGQRAGVLDGRPKQFLKLGEESILARAVVAFVDHEKIDAVQVVIAPEHENYYRAALDDVAGKILPPVLGGESRQASVYYGLKALKDQEPEYVLIHDAARPFISARIIDRVLSGLANHKAVVAALPVVDTIKRTDRDGVVQSTIDRDGLWCAQTPQGFEFSSIFAAHQEAQEAGIDSFTDDSAIAEWAGLPVHVVEGSKWNEKLTTAEDLRLAAIRCTQENLAENLIGSGFDVHRFCDGDHVWLCGVRIPHTHGLEGHSDADVALHALTDAILGAIADGDIGTHFPPSDPKWKDKPSETFLVDALDRVHKRGLRIVNVDLTLICERPKIGRHRQEMRERLAQLTRLDIAKIGIKATTTEGLGFTGRGEGIAALAMVSVRCAHK